MFPLLSPRTCAFRSLTLWHLHISLFLFLFYWSLTLHSTGTKDQQVPRFVASLTNSSTIREQITQRLSDFELHESHSGTDNQAQVARAKLACYVSSLVFGNVSNLYRGSYIDQSNTVGYRNRTEANWSELCWLPAQCIIAPQATQEVSLIMKIIHFTSARFAIRSGGHNPNPRWASIGQSGLLIDLYLLKTLALSQDKDVISIGPGNRWSDVYQYLQGTGVSAAGARVPEVGVGGQLLGGGLSYFPSAYGLSCDSVKSFEVVLSNSSVVIADEHTHSDLYTSLKGGCPNFGIVTLFDLYTTHHGQIWFQVNTYEASQMPELLAALVEYQAAAELDSKAGIIFSPSLNTTTVGMFYAAPIARPSIFQKFYSIRSYKSVVPSTIGIEAQLSSAFSSPNTGPTKYDVVAASTRVDLGLYQDIYKAFVSAAMKFAKSTNGTMQMSLQPLTTQAVLQGLNRGGNALDLSAHPTNWFTSVASWATDGHDHFAHETITSLGRTVTDLAKSRNLSLSQINPNDATFSQDPIGSFGSASNARLKAVSTAYDADGLFQELQNGGFLLRR